MPDPTYCHATRPTLGVLLVNLGTPRRPDRREVRRFLKEFLSDPRVVEAPRVLWWPVLHGIILTLRPGRSARNYAKIWQESGSPLMDISVRQATALQMAFSDQPITVELAMRYGNPSIAKGLEQLQHRGATRILVLPLYPQYSATTTATSFDAVAAVLKTERRLPELRFVNHYHDDPAYIEALASSVRAFRAQHGPSDLLLMSFHGIPQAYFDKGDPYFCECQKTARLLSSQLGLATTEWKVTFQSRLGPKQWLQPYTDTTLEELPSQGIRHVQVICPGFSADCLETLEEIAMENRQAFLEAGGECYEYIPCLNDAPAHIHMMKQLILNHIQGWPTDFPDAAHTQERAMAMGAAG